MTDVDIASLLKNFADDIKGDLRKQIQVNADISLKNHEETRREILGIRTNVESLQGSVSGLHGTVGVLWRKVNGPNVPLPKTSGEYRQIDASVAKEKPLAQTVSDHNLDLQALNAQVRVLDTKVDEAKKAADDAKDAAKHGSNIAEKVLAMNEQQNVSLGIGISVRRIGEFFVWAKTKEGQRYIATILGAATSLVTAMGTTYAILTHRLPSPVSPPPATVQTVFVPVPVPQASVRAALPSSP